MHSLANATLHYTLLVLERRLLDPFVRKQRAIVAAMLADEFREFGRSGRMYTKEEVLNALGSEHEQAIVIEDFAAASLGDAAALATYRSIHANCVARRSSVWVWRKGRWVMLFHQGTSGL